jgi:hypothetical protein
MVHTLLLHSVSGMILYFTKNTEKRQGRCEKHGSSRIRMGMIVVDGQKSVSIFYWLGYHSAFYAGLL